MRVTIAGNDDRFLACPVRHTAKSTVGVFMCDVACVEDVESLLQVHASTESALASASEDSCAQVWLAVIPFPEGAKFNRRLNGQTVHKLWAIDRDEENMFAGKGDDAFSHVRIWDLDPARDGVFRSRRGGRHFDELLTLVVNTPRDRGVGFVERARGYLARTRWISHLGV